MRMFYKLKDLGSSSRSELASLSFAIMALDPLPCAQHPRNLDFERTFGCSVVLLSHILEQKLLECGT